MRLDIFMCESGLAESRTRAKALIISSSVKVNGVVVTKAALDVADTDVVEVINELKYVSRGGLKLEGALDHFNVSVRDKTAIDVGASSGGFTDCLLQRGARHVYAVDAGSGQMLPRIAHDERVTLIENYNARYMKATDFPCAMDMAVMDVSFISQKYIIPSVASVVRDGGEFISLIKPQFEVGRSDVGRGGIVRSAEARERAVREVIECADAFGFSLVGKMKSPIEGGDGNIEFLAFFKKRCL